MDDQLIVTAPRYDPARGVGVEPEGGILEAEVRGSELLIRGTAAGFRDLARWCLALSDAASGCHVHMEPGETLEEGSVPLILERLDRP